MTLRLPKDARKVHGVNPWEELGKHVNELYWGDRDRDGPPPAKVTMFRGVIVIGAVLTEDVDLPGVLSLRTGGKWTWDDQQPEVAFALAEQLRACADALEKEAGS